MKISFRDHSGKFLISHLKILWRVSLRELKARYAGSILGFVWTILNPLIMLAIYAVVYLIIFRVRVPGLTSYQYVLYVFSGLVPFLMTSEALSGGVNSVAASKSILSNTVFPIDLTPVKSVILGQIPMTVGFVTIIAGLLLTRTMPLTIVFLPVLWILHVMWLVGMTWFLSLINLVFRDLLYVVNLTLMFLMIVSPIAYTPDMVPAQLQLLVKLNPFAYFVLSYQKIVVLGQLPSLSTTIVILVLSFGFFILGGFFFNRAKGVLIDYV